MAVGDCSSGEVYHLEQSRVKIRVIHVRIVKYCPSDPADGETAMVETGRGTVRSIRHTVDRYTIKIGFCKKIWRETVLRRVIENFLVNDFNSTLGKRKKRQEAL